MTHWAILWATNREGQEEPMEEAGTVKWELFARCRPGPCVAGMRGWASTQVLLAMGRKVEPTFGC